MNLPEPGKLWNFFHEITQIPRPSKHEQRIREYLLRFADDRNLSYFQDEAGNLVILHPGSKGMEDKAIVAMQAHMDMVCEKNQETVHNFLTDPIKTYIDGDWMKARGTTLGADNGIGMAYMLAVMDDNELTHPPLECLFTVDEETGLTGAFALSPDLLKARTLINLDSEDDGIIFIGCAGGIGTEYEMNFQTEDWDTPYFACSIKVHGLSGGHSGDDINKGLGNALLILGEYLNILSAEMEVRIASFTGGNLHNAIPREAEATFAVPYAQKERIRVLLNIYLADLEDKFKDTDPKIQINMESDRDHFGFMNLETSGNLLNFLSACPNGAIAMSKDMPGLVETSTNLASVKMPQEGKIKIVTSQRSSSNEAKSKLAGEMKLLGQQTGMIVKQGDGYPGWQPNINSAILNIAKENYLRLFNEEVLIRAIHAGLECGLFLEKYPELDMISIGPQMRGVHSPDERLSISSTEKNWKWLVEILKTLTK